jgi:hypothetical protein
MPPKAKKLSGAAAHSATRSIQAAKINSTCRLFLRRVKAAKSRCTEEVKNLESPSTRQRVQTEYEATLTNLHLALDKELDGIWAEFEECARDALARETQALGRIECAQKACNLARGNCPRPAGVRRCAMRIALQKLDPNTANTEHHSNQGHVHGARAAMARQGEVDGLSEAAAAELSAAQAHHEVLADAGWKLEKVVAGWLDGAALQQRRGQKPVVIPMLPPLLGLPYHQECSDVPLADVIRKAFDYQTQKRASRKHVQHLHCLHCLVSRHAGILHAKILALHVDDQKT